MEKQPKVYNEVTEAELLSKTLEVFGEGGEHWIKHSLSDGHGNYCMLGAMNRAARLLNASPTVNRNAKKHLALKIGDTKHNLPSSKYFEHLVKKQPSMAIATYNDTRKDFKEIKEVVCNTLKEAINNEESK